MRGMARRLCPKCAAGILLLTQALWQLLFLLTVTVWRDITVLPPLAARAELLDRARWFWLLEAPDAGTANAAMISGMMNVAEHLEAWFCLIWIGVSLRRHCWRCRAGVQPADESKRFDCSRPRRLPRPVFPAGGRARRRRPDREVVTFMLNLWILSIFSEKESPNAAWDSGCF